MDFDHLRKLHCEVRELVDDFFLALLNFEGEIFQSKLVFGEANQVFHGDLMELYSHL